MKHIARVRVTQPAKADLRKIVTYYEEEKEGLGRRFISQFDKELIKLKSFWAYEIRFKDVRTKQVKHLPYRFFYRVVKAETEIVIDAVIHAKRDTPW